MSIQFSGHAQEVLQCSFKANVAVLTSNVVKQKQKESLPFSIISHLHTSSNNFIPFYSAHKKKSKGGGIRSGIKSGKDLNPTIFSCLSTVSYSTFAKMKLTEASQCS